MQRLFYILFFFVFSNAFGQDPIFETNFEQGSFVDRIKKIKGTSTEVEFENSKTGLAASFNGFNSRVYYDFDDISKKVACYMAFKPVTAKYSVNHLLSFTNNSYRFGWNKNGNFVAFIEGAGSSGISSKYKVDFGEWNQVYVFFEKVGNNTYYIIKLNDNIIETGTKIGHTASEISSLFIGRWSNANYGYGSQGNIGKVKIFNEGITSNELNELFEIFHRSFGQVPIFETNFGLGSFIDRIGKKIGTSIEVTFENLKKGLSPKFNGESSRIDYDFDDVSEKVGSYVTFKPMSSKYSVNHLISFSNHKYRFGWSKTGNIVAFIEGAGSSGISSKYKVKINEWNQVYVYFERSGADTYYKIKLNDNPVETGIKIGYSVSDIFSLFIGRWSNASKGYGTEGNIGKTVIYGEDINQNELNTLFNEFNSVYSQTEDMFSGHMNWRNLITDSKTRLKSISCINANACFTAGDNGTLLKTTNGGLNWEEVTLGTTENLSSVSFQKNGVGYITGSNSLILKTSDYGLNWTDISFDNSPYTINDAYFLTPDTGYVCGEFGMVAKTTDGGDNWDILRGAFGVGNAKASLFFKSVDTGLVVGAGFNDAIIKTTNGGITWTEVHDNTPTELYSVQFTGKYVGYVTSSFGFGISKTADGGEGWLPLPRENASGLYSIKFPSSDIGYAVGANGTVIQTTDAGNSWTSQNSNTLEHLFDVFFIDENIGYAVGANGTIIKTTSGNGGLLGQFRQSISFQVFPNPATVIINIEISNNNKDASYVLRNMLGEEIIMGDIYNNREWVNIGNLPGGIYILTITIDNISGSKKFIKN